MIIYDSLSMRFVIPLFTSNFCRVVLYVWRSPSFSVCLSVSDEYFVISTSTFFVSGRLSTSSVSSPDAPLSN